MKFLSLRLAFFLLCIGEIACAAPQPLKISDVRSSMQEMLGYHVEYKEFSPFLARRAFRLYVYQFDPEKVYLLSDEARPYFNLTDEKIAGILQQYRRDDLSAFSALNQTIQKAILRAEKWRQEIEEELIASSQDLESPLGEAYVDFARDEKELKARIKKQLVRIMKVERKMSGTDTWSQKQKQKVFALWEKRFHRLENSYLATDRSGRALSKEMSDHYLAMHTLKAMAKSLDAHTSYFSPEEAFEMRTSLEKQFEGIGVILREGIDGVVISDLIKGGPAAKSGQIAPGDLLVRIDEKNVENAPYEEILRDLQGGESGQIRLGLKRFHAGEQPFYYEVSLKREKIVMDDERVQYSWEPYANGLIGKINLPSFYESEDNSSCEKDIREALHALKAKGDLLGIVLDMRENSGGFLTQAVKVAGLFISAGVVVISKYAQGEVQYLRDVDGRSYFTGPITILTSKASASAAEIVAQALQDYGVALVVGDERTYGKGTIQYQTVTDTQAKSFFKVTVGRYYTVSGRSTQIEGVKADIVVPTFFSIFNIGERYLEYPLKSDQIPSAYSDPLLDVDQRHVKWFEKNYLPNLQKKLSVWNQMLPSLKNNSSFRLSHNNDYQLFLKTLQQQATNSFQPTAKENFGFEDLQMREAVHLLKDMIAIKTEASLSAGK